MQPNKLHEMSPAEIIRAYRTRQNGIQRTDFTLFQRLLITHGAANQLPLFTKGLSDNTAGAGYDVTNFDKANEVDGQTMFVFDEIAIDIEPGTAVSTRAAAAAALRWKDAAYLESKGYMRVTTGTEQRIAFEGGPLRIFPGNNGLDGPAAVADTTAAAAANQTLIEAPRSVGFPMRLRRPIVFLPGERVGGMMDFGTGALALPSTTNAGLLIRYRGIKFTNVNKGEVDQLLRALNAGNNG